MNNTQIKILEILKDNPSRRELYRAESPPEPLKMFTFSYPENLPRLWLSYAEVKQMADQSLLVKKYSELNDVFCLPSFEYKGKPFAPTSEKKKTYKKRITTISRNDMQSAAEIIVKDLDSENITRLVRILTDAGY